MNVEQATKKIKEKLKIEDLVAETVTLKKSGNALTGYCPFHTNKNTPAFAVWPQTQTWKCFGACADGGDIFSYIMRRDHLSFNEALEVLARQANLDPDQIWADDRVPQPAAWQASLLALLDQFHANLFLPIGAPSLAWLHQRGLNEETLKHFKVGFNPASRFYEPHYIYGGITIPHLHRQTGVLWGCKIRLSRDGLHAVVRHWQKKNPGEIVPDKLRKTKYRTVTDTQPSLFNADDLPREQVLLCEGEFDVMLARQEVSDLVAAVSMGSASSKFSYQWVRYLLPTRQFWLALDADPAGSQSRALWRKIVGQRGQDVPMPLGCDLTDYWKTHGHLRPFLADLINPFADFDELVFAAECLRANTPEPQPVPTFTGTLADFPDFLEKHNLRCVPRSLVERGGQFWIGVEYAG